MADTPPSLESHIADLERQLQEARAKAGADVTTPYERSEVHAAVGERISQAMPTYQAPPPATTTTDSDIPSWQDPALAATVQQLVNVAFTQGIAAAVTQANASGNAALVDALHDVLTDQLYAELRARGKVGAAPEGT